MQPVPDLTTATIRLIVVPILILLTFATLVKLTSKVQAESPATDTIQIIFENLENTGLRQCNLVATVYNHTGSRILKIHYQFKRQLPVSMFDRKSRTLNKDPMNIPPFEEFKIHLPVDIKNCVDALTYVKANLDIVITCEKEVGKSGDCPSTLVFDDKIFERARSVDKDIDILRPRHRPF